MVDSNKKPITPEDLVKIKGLSDPQISPSGSKIVFVSSEYDLEEDKQKRDIWVVSTDIGNPVKITEDGKSGTPRWSPDGGIIAFYASEDEGKAICLMKPDGSDRRTLTSLETSNAFLHRTGESLAWSPDGSSIAFLGTDEPKPDYTNIVVMERLMMKHLTGFMDFRRTHIFVVDLEEGEVTKLTEGDHDNHSISWSVDGREVIFVSDRSDQSDLFVRNDLWVVDVETRKERQIKSTLGAVYRPQCSPDGKWIAYVATTRPATSNDSVAEDSHLWVVSVDGKGARDITKAVDRPISTYAWAERGEKIFFTAGDRGMRPLYSVTPEGGEITTIMSGEWQFSRGGFSLSKNGKMEYLKTDQTHPAEVHVSAIDGTEERKLTDFNAHLEEYEVVTPEEFWFTTFDGLKVKGYIAKPLRYQPGKKYPTILCVHGGPHGMFGYSFDERVQLLTSAGNVVVLVDPRGSSGYGQTFSDGCVLNWGGGDYKDLMLGLDYCIENYDFVEPERLGVTGGSYGGYMTNWIITQTDRFKAAVSRACVTNLLSFYGCSTVGSLIEQEFFGLPYDNLVLLAQWSPITHAKNVKTPLLLLHGEADYTCPIGQSEEMFKAVKRMGVDTMLVRYRGEGHGIRKKQSNKVDFYRRHLDWFNKYL